jgi:acetyl-CoA C-acetyltransferase
MPTEVVLAAAVRTPIGKFGGGLSTLSAVELGTHAARATLERSGIAPDQIDQTILGHARQAGCGPNPARQVALSAGLPVERPAFTLNQACLSGLQAVMAAIRAILVGEAHVVLAGGMESMSQVPYLLDARWGWRMGHRDAIDGMYRDGFVDPNCGQIMGQTAETLATRYEITRAEQDAYAVRTQRRTELAWRDGRFAGEVVSIEVTQGKKTFVVERDEHPRSGVTLEALAKLPPVFDRDKGSVTAGNSSGITDAAATLLVLAGETADKLGVQPMARWVASQVDGVRPEIMGIGPVPAVRNLLEITRMTLEDIDLIELNEAFAAQVLAVDRELGFDPERLNVNGGAIALGHPIGCTGARILVTLLHEMQRREVHRGLATLCVSGGMGGAMLVESVADRAGG